MKRVTVLLGILFFIVVSPSSYAEDKDTQMGHMDHQKLMQSTGDERISLGLSPKMKQHQLSNMRSHLAALQSIIGLIAEGEFENASQTAYSRLGLTEEMKNMCNMFTNEEFKELGLAFHKSGDALGDMLKTKDTTKSLQALKTTMGYCVQCHATFRQ